MKSPSLTDVNTYLRAAAAANCGALETLNLVLIPSPRGLTAEQRAAAAHLGRALAFLLGKLEPPTREEVRLLGLLDAWLEDKE